ncbi:MAG: glucose-1-phosphate adenylyltransferase subunit GlgD [Clostridia bacterium]|jgi:glucose-1-phosphate adenylyltransferase|nr:glucose-1-phosphate adenylyltransferase subunit GlgD [Clostridia bacterium]
MKNVLGIIHHSKNKDALGEISKNRCPASVPFGGKYRLIDFALSNLVNAGVGNIGVIAPVETRSLLDHLGSGKAWGLDKRHDGLFLLPAAGGKGGNNRLVDLEDLQANLRYLQKSRQDYVLLTGTRMICNLDYNEVFRFHEEWGSDVTLVCHDNYTLGKAELRGNSLIETSLESRVTAILPQPRFQAGHPLSLDMYFLKKDLLCQILREGEKNRKWDLIRDFLAKNTASLKIYAYKYRGYLAVINTLENFYRRHFDLLEPEIWRELFYGHGAVYTKYKDSPPSKYAEGSCVANALVANGCRIEGRVENSVLYRQVRIGKGALVRNCVILPKAEIEEDVLLDHVILDKEVFIRKGTRLAGEKDRPLVIGKGRRL